MTWIFFALGAPFLWAIVNIIDQYLVEKYSHGRLTSGALILFLSLTFFPERKIVGIDCSNIIYGGGALHCITMQQPRS